MVMTSGSQAGGCRFDPPLDHQKHHVLFTTSLWCVGLKKSFGLLTNRRDFHLVSVFYPCLAP